MELFDLSNRVAVVTGGNGGIGLAMARALVDANCAVSIWGRNADKLESAAKQLEGRGGEVHAVSCDVTNPDAVQRSFTAAVDRFGRIDGCFVNAGMGGGGRRSFLERTPEEWRRMFDVNLDAAFPFRSKIDIHTSRR